MSLQDYGVENIVSEFPLVQPEEILAGVGRTKDAE